MKAIFQKKYGGPDRLQLLEIDRPTPKAREVLIKVKAASVNPLDWHFMRGKPLFMRLLIGFFRPKAKVIGADLAGTVEEVGTEVTQFKVGDEVFGGYRTGAFAEYCCTKEKRLAHKPGDLSFEDAASLPVAGLTALQALRFRGQVKKGQKILINGSSGGVGTFAVQIAKSMGAEVTAVCSTSKIEMVKSLGADHIIDYTKKDFTNSDTKYELIIDNVGNRKFADLKRIMTPVSQVVGVGFTSMSLMLRLKFAGKVSSGKQNFSMLSTQESPEGLSELAEMMMAGTIRSVIHRRYTLDQVPEAITYIEEGHAQGKSIINISM